jgi:hypothetical protein
MENEIKFEPVAKQDFEKWIEKPLTDKEWEKVGSEVEGRVENFVDGLLAELVQDYYDGVFSAE